VIAANDRTPNRLYRFEVVAGVAAIAWRRYRVDPQLAGAADAGTLTLSTDKAVAVVSAPTRNRLGNGQLHRRVG
jgi:hypothetical protein